MAARSSRLVRGLGLAVALGAAGVAGCGSGPDEARERLERARAYAREGKAPETLIELRRALEADPQSAEINALLARTLHRTGNLADAAFYYGEAYRLDPTRTHEALQAARLVRFAEVDAAEHLVDQVLAAEPENVAAHVLLSSLHLVRGDAAGGLEAAERAAALAPERAGVHLALGVAHQARIKAALREGRTPPRDAFASAVAAFERATGLEAARPLHRQARLKRAMTLSWWPGRRERAAEAFRELVRAAEAHDSPAHQAAATRLAAVYGRESGDAELQRWALEKLSRLEGGVGSWLDLARLADAQGASGEAVLRRLLADRPDSARGHVMLARHLAEQGRTAEAAEHLAATAARLESPLLLMALVQARLERGEAEAASPVVERLRREHPGSPYTRLALARQALEQGRPGEAAALLEELAGTHPTWETHYNLALARLALRDPVGAGEAVERAAELAPARLLPIERLAARVHHEARRWTEAWLLLRRLQLQEAELSAAERLMLARCLYGMGRERGGHRVLEALVSGPDPPAAAVLEYVRREAADRPERTRELLVALHGRRPGDPRVLRRLTQLDLAAGRPELALERLGRAIEASGDDAAAALVVTRARVLVEMGRPDAAERELRDLLEAAPGFGPAVHGLVALYGAQGRIDRAIASLEEAAARRTLGTGGRVLLARLYIERGDRDRARRELERALADGRELPGARNDLAWLLAEEGTDLDRALRLAQQAVRALDDDPRAVDTLGWVYLKRGMAQAAAAQFALAVELAEARGRPRALFHHHHGLALLAVERAAQAAEQFETALALADADFDQADAARAGLEAARRALEPAPGA